MSITPVAIGVDPGTLQDQPGGRDQDRRGEQQPATRVSLAAARTVPASGSTRASSATAAPTTAAPTSEDALPSATQRAIAIAVIGLAIGSWRTAARTRRAATNSATAERRQRHRDEVAAAAGSTS